MKTQEDVLSFRDLTIQTVVEATELEESWDLEKMSDRFIHTFLEWDLYDSYIYNLGWSLTYTCQGYQAPIVAGTQVDTLQEAEIMAIKKVSRFLGEQVYLELMKEIQEDTFYKVTNGTGDYRGMVEIARMEQLK